MLFDYGANSMAENSTDSVAESVFPRSQNLSAEFCGSVSFVQVPEVECRLCDLIIVPILWQKLVSILWQNQGFFFFFFPRSQKFGCRLCDLIVVPSSVATLGVVQVPEVECGRIYTSRVVMHWNGLHPDHLMLAGTNKPVV